MHAMLVSFVADSIFDSLPSQSTPSSHAFSSHSFFPPGSHFDSVRHCLYHHLAAPNPTAAVEEVAAVYADIDILQNCRVEFKDGNNLQIVLVREDSSKCTVGIS